MEYRAVFTTLGEPKVCAGIGYINSTPKNLSNRILRILPEAGEWNLVKAGDAQYILAPLKVGITYCA